MLSERQHRGNHARVGSNGVRQQERWESAGYTAESSRFPSVPATSGGTDAPEHPPPKDHLGAATTRHPGGPCPKAARTTRSSRLGGSEEELDPSRFRLHMVLAFVQDMDGTSSSSSSIAGAEIAPTRIDTATMAPLAMAAPHRTNSARPPQRASQNHHVAIAAMAMAAPRRPGPTRSPNRSSRVMEEEMAHVVGRSAGSPAAAPGDLPEARPFSSARLVDPKVTGSANNTAVHIPRQRAHHGHHHCVGRL